MLMAGTDITIILAFIAGLVSFLSPCVLPLIPGYLSYLAGTSIQDANTNRFQVFLNSLFFVLGFTVIFSILGILLATVLSGVASTATDWLARVGGVVIILFGLFLTGLIKIPFLEQEHKVDVKLKFKSKYLTSFVFGAAFATGWTPCVGAVLGGILGLAVTNPGSAFFLLLAYSIGLGLPFLVVGLFTAQASEFIRTAKWIRYVNVVFGILLIVIGVLAFTQKLQLISDFEFVRNILPG